MEEQREIRDQFSKEKRSWIMSRVKSTNTTPEIILRKLLWRKGLRYRIAPKHLPGKPDIVFTKVKVTVFIDGEFWHGKKLSPERLSKMSSYWREKIKRNAQRDLENTERLNNLGFVVLRFPEKDVLKNADNIANEIYDLVTKKTKE
jgi:DNA mismatch endonuclease (patch repair protein)